MSLCLKRTSIRKYTKEAVSDEIIEKLLISAMQAPSARNQQPWAFVVIKNRKILDALSQVSRGASPLSRAPLGILTLFQEDAPAIKMCPQDLSAATQNILLEATEQNLGAVWIGVYPLEERIENVKALVDIPEKHTPFSLIAIGHPDESTEPKALRFDAARVKTIE